MAGIRHVPDSNKFRVVITRKEDREAVAYLLKNGKLSQSPFKKRCLYEKPLATSIRNIICRVATGIRKQARKERSS